MSDPVTNMQIEDVLSSIRKLVSDEVRAQTRPKVLQAAETTRDETPARRGPEMLVLTPDHRISAQSDSPEADDAEAEHSALHDEAIWAERGAEPAEASGTEFDIESFSRNLLDDDDASDSAEDAAPSVTAKAPPAEPVAYDDDGFEDEGQNAAEPMDPVDFASVQDDEFQDEPDQAVATGAGLAAFDAEIAGLDDDAEDDDVEGDRLADIIAARGEQAIPSFLRSRGVSSLDEKLAEYDTAVSQAAEELEPVQDNDATDPDALNWEDHVDEAGEDRLDNADLYSDEDAEEDDVEIDRAAYWAEDDDDEDTAEPSQLALGGVASDLLDEDMLRDLVAELVRQELQGALGERITRNVRKLVRREIQRTLAAHDLL